MPKIRAVLESLDGLSADLAAAYRAEADGKFYLDLEGTDAHPDVRGLIQNRDALKAEKAQLAEKYAPFKDFDPTKAKAAYEALQRAGETQPGTPPADIEAVKRTHQQELEQIRLQAARDKEAAEAEIGRERDAARDYFVGAEIARTLGRQEIRGSAVLLEGPMRGMVKAVRGEDGRFSLQVLDKHGLPRIKDGQGTPFTIDDLALELRADPQYGKAFDASGAGGSGGDPAGGKGAGGARTVSRHDPVAFGANLEAIAKGEVTVQ